MIQSASDHLREQGVQPTAQRLAVLRAVSGRPHATADEVAQLAQSDIGTISRQSVYDTLRLLVERGILRRIQPVGSPALFEDRVNDNHHHVICRICGRVGDVDCAVGEAPCLTAADDLGFEIDEADVAYWGRCPRCIAENRTLTGRETLTHRGRRRDDTSLTSHVTDHQRRDTFESRTNRIARGETS